MSSPSSEPGAKRRRKTRDPRTFIHTQAPVKLQITKGGGTRTWYLNKELLIQKSFNFRFILSIRDTVPLHPDTVEETVETFSTWLYTGNLVIPEYDPHSSESDTDGETDNSNDRSSANMAKHKQSAIDGTENGKPWFMELDDVEQRHFGRLLDLYLFATKYRVPTLKVEVLIDWQRHRKNLCVFPDMKVMNRALLALPPDDGLIRFEVADFGWSLHEPGHNGLDYDGLPAPFLAQLLKFMRRYASIDEARKSELHPNHDWCEFHDHPKSERRSCLKRQLHALGVKGTKQDVE